LHPSFSKYLSKNELNKSQQQLPDWAVVQICKKTTIMIGKRCKHTSLLKHDVS
jgi:hypothetical protein